MQFTYPTLELEIESLNHNFKYSRNDKMYFTDKTNSLLSILFDKMMNFKIDENKYSVWIKLPKGKFKDFCYGDKECIGYDYTEHDFNEEYIDNERFYNIELFYNDKRKFLIINEKALLYKNDEDEKCNEKISEYDKWNLENLISLLIIEINNSINKKLNNTYDEIFNEIPFRNKYGTILRNELWKYYPEDKEYLLKGLTEEDIAEFYNYCKFRKELTTFKETMTVNNYLNILSCGYLNLDPIKNKRSMTSLEMYKKNADDRDGGLLKISNYDSAEEFDKWFEMPFEEKWNIENPSHMWETIQGSSLTRSHCYVSKNEEGYYYLTFSAGVNPVINEAIKFCLGIIRKGIVIEIMNWEEIYSTAIGENLVGIVPEDKAPYEYLYGGFPVKDVKTFFNLNEFNNISDELINAINWLKIKK